MNIKTMTHEELTDAFEITQEVLRDLDEIPPFLRDDDEFALIEQASGELEAIEAELQLRESLRPAEEIQENRA